MNLDELRSVQSTERQKDSLQNLRPSFYREVGEYIAGLEDERERAAERAEDPFASPEVGRLTDEIETARDVVEAIYERRMGKLVKQASLAAAGMSADDEGLTAEETALFEDLVERIESNKTRVLDVLEGGNPDAADEGRDGDAGAPSREPSVEDDAPPVPPEEPPADRESGADAATDSSGVSAADVMGGSVEASSDEAPPDPGDATPDPDAPAGEDDPASDPVDDGRAGAAGTDADDGDVDRVTVRITRDVGAILGVDDREYALSADDVVTLPEQNAEPLVEREAAEPLE